MSQLVSAMSTFSAMPGLQTDDTTSTCNHSITEPIFVKNSTKDDHDYVTAPQAQVEIHVTTDDPTQDDDDDDDDDDDVLVPVQPQRQSPTKLQLPKNFKENSGFDMLLAAAAFAHCQSKDDTLYKYVFNLKSNANISCLYTNTS